MKRFWVGYLALLMLCALLTGALAELAFEDAANEDMMGAVRTDDVEAAALDLSLLNGQAAGSEPIAATDVNDGETIDLNEKNFPDEAFRDYVSSEYAGGEATVERSVLEGVTEMDVSNLGIVNLKGIAFFTGLERLNCCFNRLTTLNLTKNAGIVALECTSNDDLVKLDVSGCGKLESLNVDADNSLKTLNARNCVSMPSLKLLDCEKLAVVDVRGCTGMTELYCEAPLSSFNATGCTALRILYLNYTQLKSIDLSSLKALEELNLYRNKKLASLNVKKNKKLKELYCGGCRLTSLDLTQNTLLSELSCYENALTSLKINKCTKLEKVNCSDNKLASLNVSKNKLLRKLDCANNKLTSLDVSMCPELYELYCSDNKLSKLKLGQKDSLDEFACDRNALKTLDLGGCPIIKAEITCVITETGNKGKTVQWGWIGEGETGVNALCRVDRKITLTDGKAVVYKPGKPKSLRFNKSSVTVKVNKERNLGYLLDMQPAGVASLCKLSSSDESVACAYDDGYVRGVGKGTCTVTVETANGLKASIEVTVKK